MSTQEFCFVSDETLSQARRIGPSRNVFRSYSLSELPVGWTILDLGWDPFWGWTKPLEGFLELNSLLSGLYETKGFGDGLSNPLRK